MKSTEKKVVSSSGDCLLSLQQIEAGELSLPVQYSRYTILYIEEGRGSFQASYGLGAALVTLGILLLLNNTIQQLEWPGL